MFGHLLYVAFSDMVSLYKRNIFVLLATTDLRCSLFQGETVWSCHHVIQLASKNLDGKIDWLW